MKATHSVVEGLRIPIYQNLTLQVSTSGNDSTGGLSNLFRQPQAAIDWAVANLDFHNVESLTINIGNGTFNQIAIDKVFNGLAKIKVTGSDINNSIISGGFRAEHSNRIEISTLTINAGSGQTALFSYDSHIAITNSITINGTNALNGVQVHYFGTIYASNCTVSLNGSYGNHFRITENGKFIMMRGTVSINGSSSGIVMSCGTQSAITVGEGVINGSATGKRYEVTACSVISTNGLLSNIPGSIAGTVDTSSFAN